MAVTGAVRTIETILGVTARNSDALTTFMRNDEFVEGLVGAIQNRNVNEHLTELADELHLTGQADQAAVVRALQTDDTFLALTRRLDNSRMLERIDGVGDMIARAGRSTDPQQAANLTREITDELRSIMPGRIRAGSEAGQAIQEGVDGAVDAIRQTAARHDGFMDEMARLRETATAADARSRTTRNWLMGTSAVGGVAYFSTYVVAEIDSRTGASISTGAADAAFNEVERRIEEGVDVEEALDSLGSVYDAVHYVVDPLDRAREEAVMQGIRRSTIGDDGAPTEEEIRQMHSSAVLANLTDSPDFALHAGLIGYEVRTLVENGVIEEADANGEFVDRFSTLIADNMDYAALEDYPVTPEIVEEIIQTDSSVSARIFGGMPQEVAGIFVSEYPELAERHPELAAYAEGDAAAPSLADARGAVEGVVDESTSRLEALAEDPMGITGAAATEMMGDAREQFNNMSGAVVSGLQNAGLSENGARMATGLLGFMMIMGVGSRLVTGMSEGGGFASRLGESAMSLGVWTAAITTMTAILNGESPDAAFRAAEERLTPDTPESIELERSALGGLALDPATGELAANDPVVREAGVDGEPDADAVVPAAAPTTAEGVIEEAAAGATLNEEIVTNLTQQLTGLAGAMNEFSEAGLGSDGSVIETALAAGDLELAAQTAYTNLEAFKEALPANIEDRQGLIDMAVSQQETILQSSQALGFTIDTTGPGTTVAEQMEPEAHQSGGITLDHSVLASGEQLDAYETIINSTSDLAIQMTTYGGTDAQLGTATGADIEAALEAGDTRLAATIAYDNLGDLIVGLEGANVPDADRAYLIETATNLRTEIQEGGATIGIDVGTAPPAADVAVGDPDLDLDDAQTVRIPVMGGTAS